MELIVHEDEHVLVIHKPAGWNTHAPGPFANEGVYEWLKNREPRWSRLAIVHRLDKETSGLMVFGKTTAANRALGRQFETRAIGKKYIFLTDRRGSRAEFAARSRLVRQGDKYRSGTAGPWAETRFRFVAEQGTSDAWEAEPLTGRTHQIRVQAAEHGIPILGDALYGGTAAPRVCLHASELAFAHPVSGERLTYRDPPNFSAPLYAALRSGIFDPAETNAYRLIHGAADGWPGLYVDQLDGFLLTASEGALTAAQQALALGLSGRGVCHKRLERQPVNQSPEFVHGAAAPPEGFLVRENGLNFHVRLADGYSHGLFLDQRDNRRRLLTGQVAADFGFPAAREVLNAFAYTCSFSVCAAVRGARTTSMDLSRKYLDWGRENFRANGLDDAGQEFLGGDAFDWFARLGKKKRVFDVVILDPPTFSRSKESGVFQAEKDYERLTAAALPLVRAGGLLFASTNAASYKPEVFLGALEKAVRQGGRRITRQHYAPQPPDFPIHRLEAAYLKTVWLELQ